MVPASLDGDDTELHWLRDAFGTDADWKNVLSEDFTHFPPPQKKLKLILWIFFNANKIFGGGGGENA